MRGGITIVYLLYAFIGILNAIIFCILRDHYAKTNKEVILFMCMMLISAGLLSAICWYLFHLAGIE